MCVVETRLSFMLAMHGSNSSVVEGKGERTNRHAHECISDEKLLVPPQHRTTVKMPSTLHHLCLSLHLFNLSNTFDQLPHTILVLAIQPHLIITTHINRTPKHTRPFQMRRVEMRMANYNSLQSTFSLNEVDSSRVQESNAVPKDVATRSLQQDGALPDTKLLASSTGVCKTGRKFRR